MAWFLSLRTAIRHTREIEDLDKRLSSAERTLKSLDLEFNELFDKTRHMMGRMAKRFATMQELTQENLEPVSDPKPASPVSDGLSLALKDIAIRRGLVR